MTFVESCIFIIFVFSPGVLLNNQSFLTVWLLTNELSLQYSNTIESSITDFKRKCPSSSTDRFTFKTPRWLTPRIKQDGSVNCSVHLQISLELDGMAVETKRFLEPFTITSFSKKWFSQTFIFPFWVHTTQRGIFTVFQPHIFTIIFREFKKTTTCSNFLLVIAVSINTRRRDFSPNSETKKFNKKKNLSIFLDFCTFK